MTTEHHAKRTFRWVAVAVVVVVLVFVAVSLGFARRNHHLRMQRCADQMGPLVVQAADAEAVGQRLGTSGEEYVRSRQAELVQRVDAWRPGSNTLASVKQKADQSTSSRLYMDMEGGVIYVAFFDGAQRVKAYVCFEATSD